MWNGSRYDSVADPQAAWGDKVSERIDFAQVARILDAGCGSGRVTETLLRTHPALHVTALDVSDSMLLAARQRLAAYADRVTFVRANLDGDFVRSLAHQPPYDAVISTGAFHWVLDHAALYRGIFSVLRAGGQFAAQFGGHGSVNAVRQELAKLGVATTSFNHYATLEDTQRAVAGAGFAPHRCWSHPEIAAFDSEQQQVDYLESGVISPYVADRPAAERRVIAQEVARGLGAREVRFVRMNVVAQKPSRPA